MAIFTLTNALVLVNGVDLSDHVDKVTVNDGREKVDVTAMGATAKGYQKAYRPPTTRPGHRACWSLRELQSPTGTAPRGPW